GLLLTLDPATRKPMLVPTPITQSNTRFGFPGSQPTISANGTTNGIAWAVQDDAFGTSGPGVLHAYEAVNLANELYRRDRLNPNLPANQQVPSQRDSLGGAVKFVVPTISNGHVYVGQQYELDVFGLFPDDGNPPLGPPSGLTATALSDTRIQLTWTNKVTNATGVQIFRSTNGLTFTQIATVGRNDNTFIDTGLAPSTRYYYAVRATNQHGNSILSPSAVATTRIAAPVVTVADVCASSIQLSWTATGHDHYEIARSTDGTNFTLIASLPPSQTTFNDTG